jgi:hypothetical protein
MNVHFFDSLYVLFAKNISKRYKNHFKNDIGEITICLHDPSMN